MQHSQYTICTPNTAEQMAAYLQLRYQVLRAPWGQEKGSEVDALEGQSIHRMICDESGEVVAVGRVHKVDMENAQIRYMAVADCAQGQGLGSLMLQVLEQAAIERGVKAIQLNAREVALKFYQHNGYQLQKQVHTLYGDIVHFLMDKTLSVNNNHPHQQAYSDWKEHVTELKNTWHQTIPAAKAQQITPVYYDQTQFFVTADRTATKNLHNTIFAGSIYTLATLTGWGWVYMLLKQHNLKADIVLGKADIKYTKPLTGEPVAYTKAEFTSGDIALINSAKTAKISIKVHVCDGDSTAAVFNGVFFAKP